VDIFNGPRNWLKHHCPPEEFVFHKQDAVYALVRAVSKFHTVYEQSSPEMESFVEWVREAGYTADNRSSKPCQGASYTISPNEWVQLDA
jgi:hypothetical protein